MSSAKEERGIEHGGGWRAELCPDVLQLFQGSQRGFHEAVLFLVALDRSNEIPDIAKGLDERLA